MPESPPTAEGAPGEHRLCGRYASIVRTSELLALQPEQVSSDELMFVVIHQAHELWFKIVVRELEEIRDHLDAQRLRECVGPATRAVEVATLLAAHWRVLDTMRPSDFLKFRGKLAGGSGYESVQYREIEFLAGLKEPEYLDRVPLPAQDRARLESRLAEPSVRDAFAAAARRCGADRPGDYQDGPAGLVDTAERLLDFDQALTHWRSAHSVSVERQLGHQPGTGGSSGASYLRTRIGRRLFPELWAARHDPAP